MIGLIGAPVFVPAAEFAAEAAAAGLEGAEAAAVIAGLPVAAAAGGVLLFGAGIGGAILAAQLWRKYNLPGNPPGLEPAVTGGQSADPYRVRVQYQLVNGQLVNDFYPTPLGGPISGIGKGDSFGRARYYILHGNGEQTDVLTALDSLIQVAPHITEIQPATGTNNPGTMPRNFQERPPVDFPIRVPFPVTFPGEPAPTIITPEFLPSPMIDPDQDHTKPPGVLVRIPETGAQLQITPTGVSQQRYTPPVSAPGVAPQDTPTQPPPKVATEPCPCDPPPDKSAEILCRIKALEDGLLNDGYDYTVRAGAPSSIGTQLTPEDEPYAVIITITSKPQNARTEISGNNAPQVAFCGWFAARINGTESIRTPIQYERQSFLLDKTASGYSFSLYVGFSGTSQYVTRKKRPYVNAC